ncbi:MAG: aminotransferase class III-fold pyridoxal phosphate-dependent enzyme, partial [Saprospiraceae bacterium]|nr:aminotransferase class III-fold pyridoxal phosphate-dependent enzyme [Saprospiraceae bacterium]
ANGMEYFNTFGGNPVSCAIGRKVLQIIKNEQLQENAQETGMSLIKRLQELATKFEIIGDVRGHGLFIGLELVQDRITKDPASLAAKYLVNRMRERGILMSTDGPYENVIKIKPPMCFNEIDVEFLMKNLQLVLMDSALQTR